MRLTKGKKTPAYVKAELEEKSSNRSFKPKDIVTQRDLDSSSIKLTDTQETLQKVIERNILTIIQGPPGTAKTLSACYAALKSLAEGKTEKVIITKAIVESGERMGFLPGSISEKIEPYLESFYKTMAKLVDSYVLDQLKANNIIEFKPIAYMRGATYDNSFIILDESQNCDIQSLMLVTTRIGNNSKLLICGDVSQYDIKRGDVKLMEFTEMLAPLKDVGVFEFKACDIMRSKFLISVAEQYELYKDKLYSQKKTAEAKRNG